MPITHMIETASGHMPPANRSYAVDGLSGTPPRERLGQAIAEMRAASLVAERLALLLIDLDRFKLVNELCGPAAGDLVLKIVASRCHEDSRYARTLHLAADEFACLLRIPCDSDPSASWAEQMLRRIGEPIPVGQHVVHLTASVGLVTEEEDAALSPEEMLRAASIALTHAKTNGGATITRFRREMFVDMDKRAQLQDDFRSGVLRGEIVPYYQPIVMLEGAVPKGFEALIRWNHPRHGLLGPDHILPMADDMGMCGDLLFLMIRQVCRDARKWPPHFTVSINMSPAQLCNPDNALKLLQILFASGLAPGRLIVEITENALIQDLANAHETIRSLRNTGVRVALDDFGAGYASLSRLCNLEFDHLKVDGTLIHSLDRESGRKLVKAVIDLGRSLSIPVTAEGIETTEQADYLRSLDCAHGQGFLFGRPAPASTARSFALGDR